jgi:phosphoglycerate kinase
MEKLGIPTLDDIDFSGKRVFLRADLNVPVGKSGEILDREKFEDLKPTLGKLISNDCSVVIGTHQGRPGGSDFISTRQHAEILSEVTNINVQHVNDVIFERATEKITSLKAGEILMLENLRFVSEEVEEFSIEKALKTHFVKRLAPLFDVYVNDAFQTIHRAHPSLIAFPYIKPSAAGELIKKMLEDLYQIDSIKGRRVFILGGSKVEDKLKVAYHALQQEKVDEILTGGILGILFLMAQGYKVGKSAEAITDAEVLLPLARELLLKYREKIFYPVDLIVVRNGRKNIAPSYSIPEDAKIVDIGPGTVEIYKERMREANVIIGNGPMGIFEEPDFRYGTLELVKAAKYMKGTFVFCGGHLSAATRMEGIENTPNSRVYTAGGALLYYMAGMPLPALHALREGSNEYRKKQKV